MTPTPAPGEATARLTTADGALTLHIETTAHTPAGLAAALLDVAGQIARQFRAPDADEFVVAALKASGSVPR